MKTGLLIFDDDAKTTLSDKIARAAAQYKARMGHDANACYINPAAGTCVVPGIEIHPWRTILPNHLWLGVENA